MINSLSEICSALELPEFSERFSKQPQNELIGIWGLIPQDSETGAVDDEKSIVIEASGLILSYGIELTTEKQRCFVSVGELDGARLSFDDEQLIFGEYIDLH